MRKSYSIFLLALSLMSCSKGLEEQARTALSDTLKDPSSAEFKDVTRSSKPDGKGVYMLCGEVNAKNGYGGFNGFRKFMVPSNGGQSIIESDDASAQLLTAASPKVCA